VSEGERAGEREREREKLKRRTVVKNGQTERRMVRVLLLLKSNDLSELGNPESDISPFSSESERLRSCSFEVSKERRRVGGERFGRSSGSGRGKREQKGNNDNKTR